MPASAGAVAAGVDVGAVATVAGQVTVGDAGAGAATLAAAFLEHAVADFDSQACVPSHTEMDAITTSAPPSRSG
jgi:hypothetical protein